MNSNKQGFSLVEILIVVSILGIISAIAIPRLIKPTNQVKEASEIAQMQTINTQIERYQFDYGVYPTAMTEEGWGGVERAIQYWPEKIPSISALGRTYIINEATHRVEVQ